MEKKENSLSEYGLKEVKVRLKLDEQDTFMPDVHLDSPADAAEFASRMMRDLDREYTMVVNLDNKLKPINFNIVSIGSINMALTPISNIFKSSILSNAYAMMFFHNHPSGDTYPSQQDIDMTKKMIEAGKLMDVPLLDHIIIGGGNGNYYSIRNAHTDMFSDDTIDLDFIRTFNHGFTQAEQVGEQNRTFHTERGQRMDLKGQRNAVFSATINSTDAWSRYLKNASFFVTYDMAAAMQIVDRYPDGMAAATKKTWEKIGFRVKDDATGLSIFDNKTGSERIIFELNQLEDPKDFADSYLWSLNGIHAKDLYQNLSITDPEINQDGMTPSKAVQILVRKEFEKAVSARKDLSSSTVRSLEHFVFSSVTYSILSRMFKDTDRKIFFPVSDQQFASIKNLMEPALQLFYTVEKAVAVKLSDSVKEIRAAEKERTVTYGKEADLLRGRSESERVRQETGSLAPEKSSGSAERAGRPGTGKDSDLLLSVPVGLQRSGETLHGENEGTEERRNSEPTDAGLSVGNVDAGVADRSTELRGSRNGLQTVDEKNVSESDTKPEQEISVSESDTKTSDCYDVHDAFHDPFQSFRFLKFDADAISPMSEEEKEKLASDDYADGLTDTAQIETFPVVTVKENTIVPKEWAEVCDYALRDNPKKWYHGQQELITELSSALTNNDRDITEIVKRNLGTEYGSGFRFRTPDGKAKEYCSWFTEEGIILAKGRNVRTSSERILVRWEDAASRIVELLQSGQYLPDSDMEKMRSKYLHDAADALALASRDLTGESEKFFNSNVQKMSGADDIKYYFPQRTNLFLYIMRTPEGAGRLNDLVRFLYDINGSNTTDTERSFRTYYLRNFREYVLPKLDVIEKPYRMFPRVGFTYQNKPEIFVSDEELECFFRSLDTRTKLDLTSSFQDPSVLPENILHNHYGSYSGGSVGSRYFFDVESSKISLRKDQIEWQDDAIISVSLVKAGNIMKDMQSHHRFLVQKDIDTEPSLVRSKLSGEIIMAFSATKKIGNFIRFTERIFGESKFDENDFGVIADLQVTLTNEILTMDKSSNVFSDLETELRQLMAYREPGDKTVDVALDHLQKFTHNDFHPYGIMTDRLVYDPAQLSSIVEKEKEENSKSIGFASEEASEPEQLSFFSLLEKQNVSESDTKPEQKISVSESDTKSEQENPVSESDTDSFVLSYPNPEDMPSRNPEVKQDVEGMKDRLKGRSMSYMTFVLPDNNLFLEIKPGNNNLLSAEELESGMMQWDVTTFHNNFSDNNLVDALTLKTVAENDLTPEDILYTSMYGLGLLDSPFDLVNHFYGTPDSVGDIENGNKIVFRFDQDRADDIWLASRFSDFNSEDGTYPFSIAEITGFGRIDRIDDGIEEEERKEINDKASSFRQDFEKKFEKFSPEQKFDIVQRYASPTLKTAMFHDYDEGQSKQEVAERYFRFALYNEGEKPIPYRKEPEKLVENVQNVIEKASDAPERKRPVLSLGPQHSCYQMMYYLFPDLLSKDSDTSWLKYKLPGMDDLNVEHLYDNVYSIAHTFVQNGDIMDDPSMEVMVDDLLQVVDALNYQNDPMGFYEDYRDDDGIPLVSNKKRKAEDFLLQWLKNIDAQGYVLTPNLAKQDTEEEAVEAASENVVDAASTENVSDSDTKPEQEIPVSESDTENDTWSKLNPDAVKQNLEEDGVLHGEVIDESEIQKNDFVTMVETPSHRENAEGSVSRTLGNFVISNDSIATGTPKVRFGKNVAALRTLSKIEAEKRAATKEEQAILSEYSGWGGLSAAFDEQNESWQTEYRTLKNLLSEEDYLFAIGSTLNAHYTGAEIIRGVYGLLSRMGFSGGKVLEPSMGTGHFFGLMPETMVQKSSLTGVELDHISGRIAQLLYPSAKISIDGFENTKEVDTYDLAVGNVPFGRYGVNDPKFNRLNLSIHNYFFVKALDEVRPGGLVCFLTSRYTMDSKDSKVRKYLAERASLVSAIRFPQNAFQETANAEVVSDLLIFQKKDRPEVLSEYPDWVSLGLTEDDLPINEYFLDHPDHVFGTLSTKSGPFGPDLAVLPSEKTMKDLFSGIAVPHVYAPAVRPSVLEDTEHPGAVPADPSLRDYSYGIIDGKLFYREGDTMYPPAVGATPEKRIRSMIDLASKMHKVIDLQMEDANDQEVEAAQKELNTAYDTFVKSYDRINSTANGRAFSQDSDYFLICGLENLDAKGNFVSKADIFSKRTISPTKAAVHCETAEDAMVESFRSLGHIDLSFMNDLLGWGENGKDKIVKDLSGVIYRNPSFDSSDWYDGWESSDQYLSGNVRTKLEDAEKAAESDPRYTGNVEALKAVQPEPIEASEISIRLGATWIKKSYYKDFMDELFDLHGWQRRDHEILFEPMTGRWSITEKNHFGYDNVAVNETYGTQRKNAGYILEDCLNLSATVVYDTDGHGNHWKNEQETQLAQMKQEEMKRAFADWILKDPDRRKDLTDTYNRLFNSTRERTFDGSYLKDHLPGINRSIQLRPHQLAAVSRTLLSGNTLLAHAVGAGKTFEMIASAMEAKRLGLCHKSMFVVPNHLVEQWGKDFLLLYPGANILVADKKTFAKNNRKKFTARIAAGDYDAVIIGHSQFEMIPMSKEVQTEYFNREIDSAMEAMEQAKSDYSDSSQRRFTIQQLQMFIKSMQTRLNKILNKGSKDDVINFEKLGIDRLYVDEAHNYKNLYFYSKLSRVPGVNSGSDTAKTLDLAMKVSYLNQLTNYKGVIFATGTPVSNSVSECYTMMKYLEPQVLEQNGFNNFDAWATTFGEVTTAMELAPEGNGFRMKQRFAKFYNVPELMKIFREVADIKVSEDLQLDVPEAERETIVAKPSQDQKRLMEDLSDRAKAIHQHIVDSSEDNMLKITTDGRKIGLDPRLFDPNSFDDPESKVNLAVEKIYSIWSNTAKDKLTQMVFCDFSVPGKGGFNVYDDMKNKLIAKGIPAEEIAFIHSANTDAKKEQLFSQVRAGNVRILFGSTAKMGEGTNCQDRLIALHHLDAPWKPSELDQRDGRIIRQGNRNKKVHIYTYVTEGTFDAYLYQTLLRKQKFIGQIMTNKSSAREMDDVDDRAMNYAEIMAVTAGSPELREKLTLDNELASLRELRNTWKNNRMKLEDKVREGYPETIRSLKSRIENYKEDLVVVEKNPLLDEKDEDGEKKFVGMEVNGKHYSKVTDASDAIHAWADAYNPLTPQSIGHYRGFEFLIRYSSLNDDFEVILKNKGTYKDNLGKSGYALFNRLDHILDGLSDNLHNCEERLVSVEKALEDAKIEITKPFPQEEEYQTKERRLAELNAKLSLNDNSEDGVSEDDAKEETEDSESENLTILSQAPENFVQIAKGIDPDIFSSASIPSRTAVNQEQGRIGFQIQFGNSSEDYINVFAESKDNQSVKYILNGLDAVEQVRSVYKDRVVEESKNLSEKAKMPFQNLKAESLSPSGHTVTLSYQESGELKKLFGSIDHGKLRLASENGIVVSDMLFRKAAEESQMLDSRVDAVAEPMPPQINESYHHLHL